MRARKKRPVSNDQPRRIETLQERDLSAFYVDLLDSRPRTIRLTVDTTVVSMTSEEMDTFLWSQQGILGRRLQKHMKGLPHRVTLWTQKYALTRVPDTPMPAIRLYFYLNAKLVCLKTSCSSHPK